MCLRCLLKTTTALAHAAKAQLPRFDGHRAYRTTQDLFLDSLPLRFASFGRSLVSSDAKFSYKVMYSKGPKAGLRNLPIGNEQLRTSQWLATLSLGQFLPSLLRHRWAVVAFAKVLERLGRSTGRRHTRIASKYRLASKQAATRIWCCCLESCWAYCTWMSCCR